MDESVREPIRRIKFVGGKPDQKYSLAFVGYAYLPEIERAITDDRCRGVRFLTRTYGQTRRWRVQLTMEGLLRAHKVLLKSLSES